MLESFDASSGWNKSTEKSRNKRMINENDSAEAAEKAR